MKYPGGKLTLKLTLSLTVTLTLTETHHNAMQCSWEFYKNANSDTSADTNRNYPFSHPRYAFTLANTYMYEADKNVN